MLAMNYFSSRRFNARAGLPVVVSLMHQLRREMNVELQRVAATLGFKAYLGDESICLVSSNKLWKELGLFRLHWNNPLIEWRLLNIPTDICILCDFQAEMCSGL